MRYSTFQSTNPSAALVAQKVGLEVLVPQTLTRLEQEPLLEGDYYPGDVLVAVLRVPPSYWAANPAQRRRRSGALGTRQHGQAQSQSRPTAVLTAAYRQARR
jgi:hypothetical protein